MNTGLFPTVDQPWDGFRRLDVMDSLRALPDECIDLTVTDPAYESLERHRAKGSTTRLSQSKASSNEWFEVISNERMRGVFAELYRVHRPRTHLYILSDEATNEVYKTLARDAGWWVWKSLVWLKTTKVGLPKGGMGYHWRNATERVLFLEKRSSPQVCQADWTVRLDPKGKGRQLNNKGWTDVIMAEPVRNSYPTEKPSTLLRPLIENSTAPGERVYDPFAGSGSLGEAAHYLGRRFTLSDLSDASQVAVATRMAQVRSRPPRPTTDEQLGAALEDL